MEATPPPPTPDRISVTLSSPGKSRRPPRIPRWVSWMIGPILIMATGTGAFIILAGPHLLLGAVLGAAFGLALLWFLASVFLPAGDSLTCPACGQDALTQLDSESTRGIRCQACGFQDANQSSFLIAEQRTDVDRLVLETRTAKRGTPTA